MKRGQVSVFIIISIIVLVGLALFFVIKKDVLNLNEGKIPPDVSRVYDFVQGCIVETGKDAVYYVGSSGGYVLVPNRSLVLDSVDGFEGEVAYYLYEGVNYMPSKEDIENEISIYMDSFLAFCINDFKDFPDFEIEIGELESVVEIEEEKVVFNVEYDLSISKGDNSYELKKFGGEVLVRLGEIYNAVSEIMEKQMENKDAVCISCLDEIGNKYDMKIRMSESSGGIVFAFVDSKLQIHESDYEFYFANKYEVEE